MMRLLFLHFVLASNELKCLMKNNNEKKIQYLSQNNIDTFIKSSLYVFNVEQFLQRITSSRNWNKKLLKTNFFSIEINHYLNMHNNFKSNFK